MMEINRTYELLSQATQALEFRHRVLSGNLANVNTPGYQRKDVDFQTYLEQQQIAEKFEPDSLKNSAVEVEKQALRFDGNGVDLERETGELNKNAMFHRALTELTQAQLRLVTMAIRGR